MNQNELLKIKNKCSEIINLIDKINENGLIILLTEGEKLTLDIRKFVVKNYKSGNSNSYEKALINSNDIDISVNKNGKINTADGNLGQEKPLVSNGCASTRYPSGTGSCRPITKASTQV